MAPEADAVEALMRQLTLDEKISLLHGADQAADGSGYLGEAGVVAGVPRLGIPPLRLADGPSGIRLTAHATALPAPVALAATFDAELATRYGSVLGCEARALGQDVVLAPMVNLVRTPYGGRNFETLGEDPLLAADLAVAEIRGIQARGAIATVKHLAFNNQEDARQTVDVIVADQAGRETDLAVFEAAVRSGAGSVMAAYNSVNGAFACENADLLDHLLRREWDFAGWVMTDWWAAHSTERSLAAGLDMEMPAGSYFGEALRKAIDEGRIPIALVDRSVRRILSVMARFGLLDGTAATRSGRDPTVGARLARQVATAGAVLLRNERAALPLISTAARSIAVIGMTAVRPFVGGGGSSQVVPDAAASPLRALADRAGENMTVTHAVGADWYGKPIPPADLTPAVSLDRAVAAGESWEYEGILTAALDEEWTFVVHWSQAGEWVQTEGVHPVVNRPVVVFDGAELFPLEPGWGELFAGGYTSTSPDALAVRTVSRKVAAGAHTLAIRADGGADGLRFRLNRGTPATRAADLAEAVAIARSAQAAVVFAWQDATEGRDLPTLGLPLAQDDLITAVAAVNPRTIVVLSTATCVTMPWLNDTAAVLQMWYPGQEGADATAAVLFGDENPGGKLPLTYPASEHEHPVAGDPARYPGAGGRVGVSVSFTVRNAGDRPGSEVAQVYLGPSPDLGVPQAVRSLAAYRRLNLHPGEEERVSLLVSERRLSSWSPATHRWELGTGTRAVAVGSSSRDLRLHGSVTVET